MCKVTSKPAILKSKPVLTHLITVLLKYKKLMY